MVPTVSKEAERKVPLSPPPSLVPYSYLVPQRPDDPTNQYRPSRPVTSPSTPILSKLSLQERKHSSSTTSLIGLVKKLSLTSHSVARKFTVSVDSPSGRNSNIKQCWPTPLRVCAMNRSTSAPLSSSLSDSDISTVFCNERPKCPAMIPPSCEKGKDVQNAPENQTDLDKKHEGLNVNADTKLKFILPPETIVTATDENAVCARRHAPALPPKPTLAGVLRKCSCEGSTSAIDSVNQCTHSNTDAPPQATTDSPEEETEQERLQTERIQSAITRAEQLVAALDAADSLMHGPNAATDKDKVHAKKSVFHKWSLIHTHTSHESVSDDGPLLARRKRGLVRSATITVQPMRLKTSHDKEVLPSCSAPTSSLPCAGELPAASASATVLHNPLSLSRNSSAVGSNRPHSTCTVSRAPRKESKNDPMSTSCIEPQFTSNTETQTPSKDSIIERLKRFFRTRPTVEVLKEKGIYKPEPVFGSTLQAICQLEHSLVPKFIQVVCELIEHKGLEVDGLYRVSGNLSAVQKIRCQVDQNRYQLLVNEEDVHVLTGALKLFFRELAEPVFPASTTKDYLGAIKLQNAKQRFKRFDELLGELPDENRETLKMLLRHLMCVAKNAHKNRMQAHNLAIMFGPTLFSSGEEPRVKKKVEKKNKKKDEPAPVQSNSHLAFNMIMQGQIVEYLLNEQQRFAALQGPIRLQRE